MKYIYSFLVGLILIMAFLFVLNRNNIRKATQNLHSKKQISEKLNSTSLYNISDFQKANEIRNSALILDDDNFFVDISMDYFTNVSLWGFKSFAKKELIELYTKYSEKLSEKTKVKLCMTIIRANFQEYKQRFNSGLLKKSGYHILQKYLIEAISIFFIACYIFYEC